LAISAAGGHGRGWAFSDDLDLLVFADREDEETLELADALVAAVSAELTKRGILPHYLLLDYFGRYVTPLPGLAAYFSSHAEDFVAASQLLEARRVVGTSRFDERLEALILRPYVFGRADAYIRAMAAEGEARRREVGPGPCYDLNECPGGLRDVTMAFLMYKARYGLTASAEEDVVEAVLREDAGAGFALAAVRNALSFLIRLRYVYRLTVCVDDRLDFEHADVVGEVLGFNGGEPGTAAAAARKAFERTTAYVAARLDELGLHLGVDG